MDGVSIVNQYMAEGLAQLGHRVSVITLLKPEQSENEVHNNVEIKRFRIHYTKFRRYVGDIKLYQDHILSIDRENRIDVLVTVCANSFAGTCTFPILNQLHCKKILYNHGMRDGKLHFTQITSIKSLLKEMLLGKLDVHFYKKNWKYICSYDAAVHLFEHDSSHTYFEKNGFKENTVIMNTCSKDIFVGNYCFRKDQEEDQLLLNKYNINYPYFIFVGNYCFRKDQLRALSVFAEIGFDKFELVLIGSKNNDYYQKLQKYLDDMTYEGKSRIHLLCGINRNDTVKLINNSYASFMTSMNEYFPLTIIEGMAMRKPYISTNVGVLPMIPGGNICHTNAELKYWLRYYAEHEDYRDRMGTIAENYVHDNLMLDDKVRQFDALIERIMGIK